MDTISAGHPKKSLKDVFAATLIRNGLIKHTKLNRCPKKIFTSDGEKLVKKKSKSIDHPNKNKGVDGTRFPSQNEV